MKSIFATARFPVFFLKINVWVQYKLKPLRSICVMLIITKNSFRLSKSKIIRCTYNRHGIPEGLETSVKAKKA